MFATEVEPDIVPLHKNRRSVLAEASHFMQQMGRNLRTGNILKFIPTLTGPSPLTSKGRRHSRLLLPPSYLSHYGVDPMVVPMEGAFQAFLERLHYEAHWELKDHLNTFVDALQEMRLTSNPEEPDETHEADEASPRAPEPAMSEDEVAAMHAMQKSTCDKARHPRRAPFSWT